MPGRVKPRMLIAAAMLVSVSLACNARFGSAEPTAVVQGPAVVFVAPENNSTIAEGTAITFAVNALNNSGGVAKVDFRVDDTLIGSQTAPVPGQSNFTARQPWTAAGVQGHFIEAIASGPDGKPFGSAKITLQIVTAPPQHVAAAITEAPTIAVTMGGLVAMTGIPTGQAPPSAVSNPTSAATQPGAPPTNAPPVLVVKAPNLNIRAGDGTNFSIIGALKTGDVANIIGRNAAKTWWAIQKDQAQGWVIADPTLSTVQGDTSNVPLAKSPPTPTPTPK
jgi:hypothetical protein